MATHRDARRRGVMETEQRAAASRVGRGDCARSVRYRRRGGRGGSERHAAGDECRARGPRAPRARRAPPRAPRRARRGGHVQVPGAEGGDAQGARARRRAGAGVRRQRGPRAADGEDLLLLLLLGVRVAVPADGRLLQADGDERGPVRPAHRHPPLRRVPLRALLGRPRRPLAEGTHAAAGVARRVDRVHAAAELGAAGRRVVRDAVQRDRVQPDGAALRRRVAAGRALLPRARGARRLAAAGLRRAQLRPRGQRRLGHAAALLHRLPHARHPEDLLPAAAAGRHRRVLQRAGHHAGRLGRHHAAGRGRRPVRPPAHVRVAGLGAGDVLRGHRAGPQHGVQHAPLRRAAALREELHHLLRHLLRADGRGAAHRHADPVQVRVRERGDAGRAGDAAVGADARGAHAAAAGRAAAAAGAGHERTARRAATAARARQGIRADDARDAGVGDGAAPVPEREGGLLPVRGVVHGLRHRAHLHLSLLASAGHRRVSDAVRRGLRHQPHLRDLRLLLQLQTDHADGPREGAVPGAGGQRAPVPVHLVPGDAVVGAAVRVRAGRDARRRVGRLLLVHSARRAARPALVGAGRAAGSAPRAGTRLRRGAGRDGGGALGHHAHLRRLRSAVRRGADRLRVHQLPRRRRGRDRRRRARRGGAGRGRGGRAGAARRALQPAASRALLDAPRRPAPPRPVRRHAELQRRGEPGRADAGGASPRQPVPVGAGHRRARLQVDVTLR